MLLSLSPLRRAGLPVLLLAGALGPARAQLYAVRDGQLPYAGHSQASANVVVDGPVDQTREVWQDYMKTTYQVPFKSGLGGLVGKNTVLTARQVPTFISSRPVDLYAAFTALTDSTTEVALFGGWNERSPFSPEQTSLEYRRLREMLTKFAPAARYHAYEQQVRAAEAEVAAADKEQDKLQRGIQATQASTAANLRRIEELRRQNQDNALHLRQDSTQLVLTGQRGTAARELVQRRRARLSTVAPR